MRGMGGLGGQTQVQGPVLEVKSRLEVVGVEPTTVVARIR